MKKYAVIHEHEYGETAYSLEAEMDLALVSQSVIAMMADIDFEPEKGECIKIITAPRAAIVIEDHIPFELVYLSPEKKQSVAISLPANLFSGMDEFYWPDYEGGDYSELNQHLKKALGFDVEAVFDVENKAWNILGKKGMRGVLTVKIEQESLA